MALLISLRQPICQDFPTVLLYLSWDILSPFVCISVFLRLQLQWGYPCCQFHANTVKTTLHPKKLYWKNWKSVDLGKKIQRVGFFYYYNKKTGGFPKKS